MIPAFGDFQSGIEFFSWRSEAVVFDHRYLPAVIGRSVTIEDIVEHRTVGVVSAPSPAGFPVAVVDIQSPNVEIDFVF